MPISQIGKQSHGMRGADLGSEPESVQLVLRPCSCSSGRLGPLSDREPSSGRATPSALLDTESSRCGLGRAFSKHLLSK